MVIAGFFHEKLLEVGSFCCFLAQEACGEQLERANALIFSVDSNMCLEISTLIKRKVTKDRCPLERDRLFFFSLGLGNDGHMEYVQLAAGHQDDRQSENTGVKWQILVER